MSNKGTLIFFCGKMGAGKSTLSRKMASELDAVLLSEDEWLAAIYPEEINTFEDYLKYSARLKPLLKRHVREILDAGVSVVMDFPGNTVRQRAWFKEILSGDRMPHKLVYLDVEDPVCLQRLARRREEQPQRARFDTEQVFTQVTRYFQPPSDEEGFVIDVVSPVDA